MLAGRSCALSTPIAAVLGWVADVTSIGTVYKICSFLPAIGILVMFLPDMRALAKRA